MKIPELCKQKSKSGHRAFVIINGTRFYCGTYGTPESEENYQRIIAEWLVSKRSPDVSKTEAVTINHLVTAFLEHAKSIYCCVKPKITC